MRSSDQKLGCFPGTDQNFTKTGLNYLQENNACKTYRSVSCLFYARVSTVCSPHVNHDIRTSDFPKDVERQ